MKTNTDTALSPPENSLLIDISDRRWEEFSRSQKNSTIFHHPAWIKLLAECYGFQPFIAVVCDDSGRIQAGIPIMEVKSWLTSHRWVSLPFSDYCSPLFTDQSWLNRLTESLMYFANREKPLKLEVRWSLPANYGMQESCQFVTHSLELQSDIGKVIKAMNRTQYQNVRRAEREGVQIKRGKSIEDMRIFYHQQFVTRRRHGLPVQPWKFFELLYHRLLERDMGFLLLASKDAQYLATGIFLYTQQTLTYKYAASVECQDFRSNHLLTWKAICWGCENGFKHLDFGRSSIDNAGLRSFKQRWGAVETPLRYSRFPASAAQSSPKRLLPLMRFVIRNSPLWVCSATGKLLYRHFA